MTAASPWKTWTSATCNSAVTPTTGEAARAPPTSTPSTTGASFAAQSPAHWLHAPGGNQDPSARPQRPAEAGRMNAGYLLGLLTQRRRSEVRRRIGAAREPPTARRSARTSDQPAITRLHVHRRGRPAITADRHRCPALPRRHSGGLRDFVEGRLCALGSRRFPPV